MFKKLDNKGNTMAIVLIGIFILSILGTLILGTTGTNYNMKVNDRRSQNVFYYAEKAMDEVYAGVGKEVMDSITAIYSESIESYVYQTPINRASGISEDAALLTFRTKVRDELTTQFKSGSYKVDASGNPMATNPDYSLAVDKQLFARMYDYISAVSGYSFEVYPSNGAISISYLKKVASGSSVSLQPLAAGEGMDKVDVIRIENVGVKCSSLGYSSSIVTDFEINIPNMLLNFQDSAYSGDIDDLAKYALVCEGAGLSTREVGGLRNTPAIVVGTGSDVRITGSLFADGTVYTTSTRTTPAGRTYYASSSTVTKNNPSVELKDSAAIDINSKVFYCENDFLLNNNTNAILGNLDSSDTVDQLDSLQFYANNIKTVLGTSNAKFLFLGGNCLIKDDLEINGDNSKVYIGGNYFGYGMRDNDHNGIEDNSNAVNGIGVGSGIDPNTEHKDSSAIIINGQKASVNFQGATENVTFRSGDRGYTIPKMSKLVLLGRSYIDLDAAGTNHTYMTGESVSFKGNQNIYLATTDDVLSDSSITMNPMDQSAVISLVPGATSLNDVTYAALGLDSDKVVAKRVSSSSGLAADGKLYFYMKQVNPDLQTAYMRDTLSNARSQKRAELIKQLGATGLDVTETKIITGGLNYYAVGVIMDVARSGDNAVVSYTTTNYNPAGSLSALSNASNRASLVEVINNRANNVRRKLKDLSEDAILLDNPAAIGTVNEEEVESTITANTPYEYYINREKMLDYAEGSSKEIIFDIARLSVDGENADKYNCDAATANGFNQELKDILNELGITTGRVGVIISNNTSAVTTSTLNLRAGVVISEVPYYLTTNFNGLIMTNSSLTLVSNIDVTASERLTKFMFEHVDALQNILNDDFRSTGVASTDEVVGGENNVSYTNVVKKQNWRKDTN